MSIHCVLHRGVKHKIQAADLRFNFKEHAYTKVFRCLILLISTLSETDREWAPLRTRSFDINMDSSSGSRSELFWTTKQQKIKTILLRGFLTLSYIRVSLRLTMVPSRGHNTQTGQSNQVEFFVLISNNKSIKQSIGHLMPLLLKSALTTSGSAIPLKHIWRVLPATLPCSINF